MENDIKVIKREVMSGLRNAKMFKWGESDIELKKTRPLCKRPRTARKFKPIVVIQRTRGGIQMTIMETVDVSMEAKQPKSWTMSKRWG